VLLRCCFGVGSVLVRSESKQYRFNTEATTPQH
jgi:hypothetical protein